MELNRNLKLLNDQSPLNSALPSFSNTNSNSLNSDASPSPYSTHLDNSDIPRLPPDHMDTALNNPCLDFNVFDYDARTLKVRSQGIKYAVPYKRSERDKPSFIIRNHYKKRAKNECIQYKLSVKEIGTNLERIMKQQILSNKARQSKPMIRDDKDILMIEGPLNDYTKFTRANPVNLKMIRSTRNTTNAHQSYQRVKTVRDCEIGDEVILINNLQRQRHYKAKHLQTDILQVHGVVNQIHPHYITIIVPVNRNQHYIQRKIYSFNLRDDSYGAVYVVNRTAIQ
eukprot:4600_1